MKPGKYIYYPILVILLYFGVDKICLDTRVKMLTQQDAVFLYFDYKAKLLKEMERVFQENSKRERARQKKIVMVLGSSRLMFFSYPQFSLNFPEWEIFNFSAPVTAPAYYAYILQRTLEKGIKPDYILLETDPYQFNANSSVFVRSNLAYSFDFKFILKHANLITNDEISYFLARCLFAGYKYPPWPDNLVKRLQNRQYLIKLLLLEKYQELNRGAGTSLFFRPNWYQIDFPWLAGITEKDFRRMYSDGDYKVSDRQFVFLGKILEMARKNKIAVLMLRPPVSRPMELKMAKDVHLNKGLQQWEQRFRTLIKPYRYPYVDLGKRTDFNCNTYVDATHMSLDCYHPMLILAMRKYEKSLPSRSKSDISGQQGQ